MTEVLAVARKEEIVIPESVLPGEVGDVHFAKAKLRKIHFLYWKDIITNHNFITRLENDAWHQFTLARIYAMTDQKSNAIAALYKAIEMGWEPNPLAWVHGTPCDNFLNPIRETEEYKTLIKKHFPQYYDIATRVPGKKK